MKKLPIGISTFSEIINDNYLYIDKTADIYRLVNFHKFLFLSRPRRFGKSLLISTLEQIYSGNKELFKDLAIYSMDYSWKKYPIIKLDFSSLKSSTPEIFEKRLIASLKKISRIHKIRLYAEDSSGILEELLEELSKIEKVVILIDEYDAPILRNINNLELAEANKEILRDFYTTIKSNDQHIHKFFMTGVTKVAKASFFSGFNNAVDISLSTEFPTILGYTQRELEFYLKDYLDIIVNTSKITALELKEKIKYWYNGYNFSINIEKVYNPFSIYQFLTDNLTPNTPITFKNYWIETGTTSYLMYLLKKNVKQLVDLNSSLNIEKHIKIPSGSMTAFELKSIPFDVLLLQSGYLTIIDYKIVYNIDSNNETLEYYVYYPNQEVKRSMEIDLLAALVNKEVYDVSRQILALRDSLEHNDIDKFFMIFKSIMANIPFDLLEEELHRESFYHIILIIILNNLNFRYAAEEHTDKGSIDLTVETNKFIYLFEFKLNSTPKAALKQIDNRKYYEKYLTSPKTIVLVGAAFNIRPREILFESKILK